MSTPLQPESETERWARVAAESERRALALYEASRGRANEASEASDGSGGANEHTSPHYPQPDATARTAALTLRWTLGWLSGSVSLELRTATTTRHDAP